MLTPRSHFHNNILTDCLTLQFACLLLGGTAVVPEKMVTEDEAFRQKAAIAFPVMEGVRV